MSKPRNYWTKEKCKEDALKYNIRENFKKGYVSAYNAALRNKWLDEICLHMKSNKK